jgi:hypothetical protein
MPRTQSRTGLAVNRVLRGSRLVTSRQEFPEFTGVATGLSDRAA